jgi:hypothetical protein
MVLIPAGKLSITYKQAVAKYGKADADLLQQYNKLQLETVTLKAATPSPGVYAKYDSAALIKGGIYPGIGPHGETDWSNPIDTNKPQTFFEADINPATRTATTRTGHYVNGKRVVTTTRENVSVAPEQAPAPITFNEQGKTLMSPGMAYEKGLISQREKEHYTKTGEVIVTTPGELAAAQAAKKTLQEEYPHVIVSPGVSPLAALYAQEAQEIDIKARRGAESIQGELYYGARQGGIGVISDVIDFTATELTEGLLTGHPIRTARAYVEKRQKEKEAYIRETIVQPKEWNIESGDPRMKITIPGEFAGISTEHLAGNVGGGALLVGGAAVPAAGVLMGAGFTGLAAGRAIQEPTAYNIVTAGLMGGAMFAPALVKGSRQSAVAVVKRKTGRALGIKPKLSVMEYGPRSVDYTFSTKTLNLEKISGVKVPGVGETSVKAGTQTFKLVQEKPGALITERSIAARLGITKPKYTDILPKREALAWKKTEVVQEKFTEALNGNPPRYQGRITRGVKVGMTSRDIDMSRIMGKAKLPRGDTHMIMLKDAGGETMRRTYRGVIFDRSFDRSAAFYRPGREDGIVRTTAADLIKGKAIREAAEDARFRAAGTPTKSGGRIIKVSDILGEEKPQKGTIETGGRTKLMLRTKTEEVPKIEGRAKAIEKELLGTESRTATTQDILTRTRFNVGIRSLLGARSGQRSFSRQKIGTTQLFGPRQIQRFAPLTITRVTTAPASRQAQRQAQATPERPMLGSAFPVAATGGRGLATGGLLGGGTGEGKAKRQTFGRGYEYKPSLAGIFSGKTIRKAPKGTLTGLEVRYPVARRRKKRR